MKQKVIEPVLAYACSPMVVMAVKYGSIRVTGSGDAYIKETPVVVVDAGHGGTDPGKGWSRRGAWRKISTWLWRSG